MPKSPRKPAAGSALPFEPQPVVIDDCIPHPNPVPLSRAGVNGPNRVFFTTPDRLRVYEVKIKGKVFAGKPGAFKMSVWYGNNSETLTLDPAAKKEEFRYSTKVLAGPSCLQKPKDIDPPVIIVQD